MRRRFIVLLVASAVLCVCIIVALFSFGGTDLRGGTFSSETLTLNTLLTTTATEVNRREDLRKAIPLTARDSKDSSSLQQSGSSSSSSSALSGSMEKSRKGNAIIDLDSDADHLIIRSAAAGKRSEGQTLEDKADDHYDNIYQNKMNINDNNHKNSINANDDPQSGSASSSSARSSHQSTLRLVLPFSPQQALDNHAAEAQIRRLLTAMKTYRDDERLKGLKKGSSSSNEDSDNREKQLNERRRADNSNNGSSGGDDDSSSFSPLAANSYSTAAKRAVPKGIHGPSKPFPRLLVGNDDDNSGGGGGSNNKWKRGSQDDKYEVVDDNSKSHFAVNGGDSDSLAAGEIHGGDSGNKISIPKERFPHQIGGYDYHHPNKLFSMIPPQLALLDNDGSHSSSASHPSSLLAVPPIIGAQGPDMYLEDQRAKNNRRTHSLANNNEKEGSGQHHRSGGSSANHLVDRRKFVDYDFPSQLVLSESPHYPFEVPTSTLITADPATGRRRIAPREEWPSPIEIKNKKQHGVGQRKRNPSAASAPSLLSDDYYYNLLDAHNQSFGGAPFEDEYYNYYSRHRETSKGSSHNGAYHHSSYFLYPSQRVRPEDANSIAAKGSLWHELNTRYRNAPLSVILGKKKQISKRRGGSDGNSRNRRGTGEEEGRDDFSQSDAGAAVLPPHAVLPGRAACLISAMGSHNCDYLFESFDECVVRHYIHSHRREMMMTAVNKGRGIGDKESRGNELPPSRRGGGGMRRFRKGNEETENGIDDHQQQRGSMNNGPLGMEAVLSRLCTRSKSWKALRRRIPSLAAQREGEGNRGHDENNEMNPSDASRGIDHFPLRFSRVNEAEVCNLKAPYGKKVIDTGEASVKSDKEESSSSLSFPSIGHFPSPHGTSPITCGHNKAKLYPISFGTPLANMQRRLLPKLFDFHPVPLESGGGNRREKDNSAEEIHTSDDANSDHNGDGEDGRSVGFQDEDFMQSLAALSYYCVTHARGGWDCGRHYEWLGAGCVPYFIDIYAMPPTVLSQLPKQILRDVVTQSATAAITNSNRGRGGNEGVRKGGHFGGWGDGSGASTTTTTTNSLGYIAGAIGDFFDTVDNDHYTLGGSIRSKVMFHRGEHEAYSFNAALHDYDGYWALARRLLKYAHRFATSGSAVSYMLETMGLAPPISRTASATPFSANSDGGSINIVKKVLVVMPGQWDNTAMTVLTGLNELGIRTDAMGHAEWDPLPCINGESGGVRQRQNVRNENMRRTLVGGEESEPPSRWLSHPKMEGMSMSALMAERNRRRTARQHGGGIPWASRLQGFKKDNENNDYLVWNWTLFDDDEFGGGGLTRQLAHSGRGELLIKGTYPLLGVSRPTRTERLKMQRNMKKRQNIRERGEVDDSRPEEHAEIEEIDNQSVERDDRQRYLRSEGSQQRFQQEMQLVKSDISEHTIRPQLVEALKSYNYDAIIVPFHRDFPQSQYPLAFVLQLANAMPGRVAVINHEDTHVSRPKMECENALSVYYFSRELRRRKC